ncbi:MAG: Hsp70 family protein [Sporichthyaceae bacterium]
MAYRLGVELGRTHTVAVAVPDDDAPRPVTLGTEALAMPTALFVERKGGICCGPKALELGTAEPDRLLRGIVERIGAAEPMTFGSGKHAGTHHAQDIAAAIVAWVMARAVEAEGARPTEIAVALPADLCERRTTEPLKKALKAQGLGHVRLVQEYFAAGRLYTYAVAPTPGQPFATLHIGASGVRAAVLRGDLDGNVWPLGVPAARAGMGGDAYETAVLRRVLTTMGMNAARAASEPSEVNALRAACRWLREDLQSADSSDVALSVRGTPVRLKLTREQYDADVADAVAAGVDLLADAVAAAGVKPTDLAAIMLCGSAVATPAVAIAVAERFAGVALIRETDPSLTVATGAALVLPEGADTESDVPGLPAHVRAEAEAKAAAEAAAAAVAEAKAKAKAAAAAQAKAKAAAPVPARPKPNAPILATVEPVVAEPVPAVPVPAEPVVAEPVVAEPVAEAEAQVPAEPAAVAEAASAAEVVADEQVMESAAEAATVDAPQTEPDVVEADLVVVLEAVEAELQALDAEPEAAAEAFEAEAEGEQAALKAAAETPQVDAAAVEAAWIVEYAAAGVAVDTGEPKVDTPAPQAETDDVAEIETVAAVVEAEPEADVEAVVEESSATAAQVEFEELDAALEAVAAEVAAEERVEADEPAGEFVAESDPMDEPEWDEPVGDPAVAAADEPGEEPTAPVALPAARTLRPARPMRPTPPPAPAAPPARRPSTAPSLGSGRPIRSGEPKGAPRRNQAELLGFDRGVRPARRHTEGALSVVPGRELGTVDDLVITPGPRRAVLPAPATSEFFVEVEGFPVDERTMGQRALGMLSPARILVIGAVTTAVYIGSNAWLHVH